MQHKLNWEKCELCDLCATRNRVVLVRGNLPCEVLFIGEAPGASEDVIGQPFVGPAGKLLTKMVYDAERSSRTFRHAFTNLVACIPIGDDGNKTVEPSEVSIKACVDRLEELIKIAKPRGIVMVGKLAAKWIPKMFGYAHAEKFATIDHPAFILRMNEAQRPLTIQRNTVAISDFVTDLGKATNQ